MPKLLTTRARASAEGAQRRRVPHFAGECDLRIGDGNVMLAVYLEVGSNRKFLNTAANGMAAHLLYICCILIIYDFFLDDGSESGRLLLRRDRKLP